MSRKTDKKLYRDQGIVNIFVQSGFGHNTQQPFVEVVIHVPQELGHWMAQAAMLVVDVVIATEGSMDEEGLLAVDENGVRVG